MTKKQMDESVDPTDQAAQDPNTAEDSFESVAQEGAADAAAPAGGAQGEAVDAKEPAEGQDAAEEQDPLAAAQAQIADLEDQLARRNADLYNLQEEYKRYVRRSKAEIADHKNAGVQSVGEALMPVLDDLALAREHGDLEGPTLAMADKLENTLKTQFGIERYGAQGEEFNPMVHDALTNMSSEDVTVPTVAHVIQPGYRCGERILRAARVAVQSPA